MAGTGYNRILIVGLLVLAAMGIFLLVGDGGEFEPSLPAPGQSAESEPDNNPVDTNSVLKRTIHTGEQHQRELGDETVGPNRAERESAAPGAARPSSPERESSPMANRGEIPVVLGARPGGEELLIAGESSDHQPPRATTPIDPRWSVGDVWSVHTYYRNMAAAADGDRWSGPIVWNFRVAGRERVQGRDSFVVRVSTDSGDEKTPGNVRRPAHFYVDVERFVLLASSTWQMQRGVLEAVYTTFDESRSGTSGLYSIIPFDLPPAGTLAHLEPAGAPIYDAMPRSAVELFPGLERWLGAPGPYFGLSYTHNVDGTRIRQHWISSDLRWPVTSWTATRRSYRIGRGP